MPEIVIDEYLYRVLGGWHGVQETPNLIVDDLRAHWHGRNKAGLIQQKRDEEEQERIKANMRLRR